MNGERPDKESSGSEQSVDSTKGENFVADASFAQQRLWILDQFAPGGSQYNLSKVLRLRGDLDRNALLNSLNEIVRRHEVMRTTFTEQDGLPVQVVVPRLTLELPVVDICDLPESEREAKAIQLMERGLQQNLDLEKGPLFLVSLLELGEHEHILVLIFHHINSDGWSMGILSHELSVLYSAYTQGQSSPLPELPIQYADFSVWQRNWLQGEVLEQQLVYWHEQLAGAQVLDIPTDHPRPAIQTFAGATKSTYISATLTRALTRFSQNNGVTLYMTMLAAFQVLLHRYSQQDDITVGSPIAGRNRTEIEGLIGFFVNTLVLRSDLSDDPTFSELLDRVRIVCLDAYAHQDLPFEKLVEVLKPERELSRNPLFQVMLAFQNTPDESLALHGLDVEEIIVDDKSSKFDLTLYLTLKGDEIEARYQYNTDLFDELTINRMSDHYLTLLDGILQDANQHISELPLLSKNERQQLLVEWNKTAADYPVDKCIHQLFELQVELTPDATAVFSNGQKLSFAKLNERANQLAAYLQNLGIGPEVLTGICIERSLDMMVGVLAILKAGGAYVPLDPAYPQERLAYMLEDSAAKVLVTQQSLLTQFESDNRHTVCLDRDWDKIQEFDKENPKSSVCASNLAYTIYTSGSTGKPKGVMIEHRNVAAFIHWAGTRFGEKDHKGVLASTSLCFDVSVFELFLPLLKGGQVLLVDNALQLLNHSAYNEVSLVCTVPSVIAELIELNQVPPSTQILTLGGEFLKQSLVDKIYTNTRIEKVFDLYGPTEDTVFSTCTLRIPDGFSTIGRPITNTQVYILDRKLNPVPVGIPGELHISGAGLARGYLNRPELTAEKFIRNPFSGDPASRLYKTGDLTRYLTDGSIEYLGRIDHQVKIRGYRIELGEIESVLTQYPGVHEAVVMAREDISASSRLVAYIVPEAQHDCAIDELLSFIRQYLPEYMLPSAFVTLVKLPLTPNGKIDRKALPEPDHSRPDTNETYVAPGNPIEEKLAAIWAEVLNLDRIGIKDNFFSLGGHSLLATQVIARSSKAFHINIPLRVLFESPTIAAMATTINGLDKNQTEPVKPAITARPRK